MQIEYSQSNNPWSMTKMHEHSAHELYFLLSGSRRYFVGDTIYDVEAGELVLIPKNQLHRTVATGNFRRYVLYLTQEECEAFVGLVGQEVLESLLKRGCLQLPREKVQKVQKAFEQLDWEFSGDRPYREGMCIHLVNEILLCALRYGNRKGSSRAENTDKIQDVARYISHNFSQEITLDSAAELACMERTYFSKRFKALTGFGFQEYLTQIRLKEAQELLRDSRMSVNQIAEACGFSGGNYFGDVFRRYMGISPSRYRQELE